MPRSAPDPDARARAADVVRALRAGATPEDLGLAQDDLEAFGPWRDGIQALLDAATQDGDSGADLAYGRLCQVDQAWISLLAAAPPPERSAGTIVPDLPEAARAVMDVVEPAGAWIDAYLHYGRQAVPMAPPAYHEAAALWLAATAIGRRCKVTSGRMSIYTNLWYILVAPPALYRKSSTLDLVREVALAAGLEHPLLERDKVTPEALIDDLNPYHIPPDLTRANWDRHAADRAWANTRGWLQDEIHRLFVAAKRDFNADLLPMLLQLYNGANINVRTKARGSETVQSPYLTILGASSPAGMQPFLSDPAHWESGLWSRFIVLPPGDPAPWQLESDLAQPPSPLVRRLRALRDLFPLPEAELVAGKRDDVSIVHRPAPCIEIARDLEVTKAWQAYRKALEYDLLRGTAEDAPGALPEHLAANYVRLPGVCIRIAMVLACLDAADAGTGGEEGRGVRIELRHYARAQRITEGYRATLHEMYGTHARTEESGLQRRIMKRLKEAKRPMTAYDLQAALRAKPRDVLEALALMASSGVVGQADIKRTNGYPVTVWTLIDQAPTR